MADGMELAQPVIDQEKLDQQRRTAKDEDIGAGDRRQDRIAADPHPYDQHRQNAAGDDRYRPQS